MTGYVPRSGAQKKKDILEHKEYELKTRIQKGENPEVIEKACEKVRKAQLGVLKALLHEIEPVVEPSPKKLSRFKNIKQQQAEWLSFSVEEIVEKYNYRG